MIKLDRVEVVEGVVPDKCGLTVYFCATLSVLGASSHARSEEPYNEGYVEVVYLGEYFPRFVWFSSPTCGRRRTDTRRGARDVFRLLLVDIRLYGSGLLGV